MEIDTLLFENFVWSVCNVVQDLETWMTGTLMLEAVKIVGVPIGKKCLLNWARLKC